MFAIHVNTIELALFSAGLSMFIEFGFHDGRLLQWWLPFWATLWLKLTDKKLLSKIQRASAEQILTREFEDKREYLLESASFFIKPLGYCVVCFNVWVSLVVLLITNRVEHNIYQVLCYFIISNLAVRFLNEKLL